MEEGGPAGGSRMKALIFNGSTKGDDVLDLICNLLVDRLEKKDCDVKMVALADKEIAPCLGCFGCWLKTPGVCVIDDAGRDIPKMVIQSDVLVLYQEWPNAFLLND